MIPTDLQWVIRIILIFMKTDEENSCILMKICPLNSNCLKCRKWIACALILHLLLPTETIPYRVMVYLKDNLGESWKDLAVCLKIPSPRIKGIEADAWQVTLYGYVTSWKWQQTIASTKMYFVIIFIKISH
jgi:hypothetical protein